MYVLLAICLFAFVTLILGLAYRQIFSTDEYREAEQIQGLRRIIIPAPRGTIYDRNGIILARNEARYAAVLYLRELRRDFWNEYLSIVRAMRRAHEAEHGDDDDFSIDDTAVKNLAKYFNENRSDEKLDIKEGTVQRLLAYQESLSVARQTVDKAAIQEFARYEIVSRCIEEVNRLVRGDFSIDFKTVKLHFSQNRIMPLVLAYLSQEEYAILTEKLPVDSPIQFYIDSVRNYPYGSLACHTIGYVSISDEISREGIPDDELRTFVFKGKIGRAGIEKSFDKDLRGESGFETWTVDPSGFQADRVEYQAPKTGKDIYLSIDAGLQAAAEKAFTKEKGSVIVLDVKTGEILTMMSRPGFNLQDLTPFVPENIFTAINESGGWLDRSIQGLYPAGSTFKLMTAIAGLRAGLDPNEKVFCGGSIVVNGRRIPCHSRAGHGEVDMRLAIAKSCNVYFYQLGLKLGGTNLAKTARDFGYGKKTGVELPSETSRTIVPDPEWKKLVGSGNWVNIDTTNTSIGQGYLLSTPLQVVMATASIARNDILEHPTIIRDGNQGRELSGRSIGISNENYKALIAGMKFVVSPIGTGKFVQLKNVKIAGKSGTAQVTVKGVPLQIAWFTGFAPADDPQIAFVVMAESVNKDEEYGGGSTAGPIVKKVLDYYFRDLENPSTETVRSE